MVSIQCVMWAYAVVLIRTLFACLCWYLVSVRVLVVTSLYIYTGYIIYQVYIKYILVYVMYRVYT